MSQNTRSPIPPGALKAVREEFPSAGDGFIHRFLQAAEPFIRADERAQVEVRLRSELVRIRPTPFNIDDLGEGTIGRAIFVALGKENPRA